MSESVLLVDDDPSVLEACQRRLRKRFDIDTAGSGAEGLEMLHRHGPYAVIVSDQRMPGMDGIEFLGRAKAVSPDSVRMMLTGNADLATAMAAVNDGNVFRFITKPCQAEDLARFVEAGIRQYRLVTAERDLLENTLQGAIKVCTEILAAVDPRTHGMALQTRDLARALGGRLGLENTWELEVATMLCRVGNATIPPVVVVRSRGDKQLSPVEAEMLARVPEIGHDLLANIPRLESVARIVRYSDKGYDGSGRPEDAVKGEDIPVEARVLKAARDLLELESFGEPRRRALEIMRARTGRYDPRILDLAEALARDDGDDEDAPETAAVTFRQVRVGDVLASDVESLEGVLLVQSGTTLSPTLLERLGNFAKLEQIKEPIHVHRAEVGLERPCGRST